MAQLISFILISFLFLNARADAVQYICWQQGDFPGFAFESASKKCDDKQVDAGAVSASSSRDKEIICAIPAVCLPLTEQVVNHLKIKTGLSSLDEIKKLDSAAIQAALTDSRFSGRVSQVTCKGQGRIKYNSMKQIVFDEAKCPSVTTCANVEDVFYNMSLTPPQGDDSKKAVSGETTPRTGPTRVIQ